jgi:hypothetical protein
LHIDLSFGDQAGVIQRPVNISETGVKRGDPQPNFIGSPEIRDHVQAGGGPSFSLVFSQSPLDIVGNSIITWLMW